MASAGPEALDLGQRKFQPSSAKTNWAALLSNRDYWGFYFLLVVSITVAGIGYMGGMAVFESPPLCDFVTPSGEIYISADMIKHGEEIFHLRGLMSYGTFLGDGSERGPDYTAEALHITASSMGLYYEGQLGQFRAPTQLDMDSIKSRVRREMHNNTYDKEKDVVVLNEAQMNAWKVVATHYRRMYQETDYRGLWPADQITKPKDVEDLAAFFFWGGWLCAAARPGEDYSYTHNWPYDPLAGNHPTPEVVMWSLISILVLFVGIGITLYVYGQFKDEVEENEGGDGACNTQSLTTQDLENGVVRPTQRATYKFFVLAMFAFFIQTFAGIACSIDFVRPLGMSVTYFLPFSVWRSYHACFQIYWFFVVWVGSTIFCLPRFSKVPMGQSFLIETLFIGCAVVAVGGLVGIPLGQGGYLQGKMAYWFGSQGWEFMELGRLFQDLLLAGFVMWIVILFRGVYPYITWKKLWSPPAWLFYGSMVMVAFLFFSLNVTPKTNFIVSDFWRWMVVHMWVEVTFEVFTTVVVSFLYTEMGLVSRRHAERATYIAVMLFFLTATIGVGHNFYWIANPTGVIALGSTFSTTQVLPLILLTLDAWTMMQEHERAECEKQQGNQKFIMKEVWLFLVGINFWNVFGAGVLGSLVNLPIINYYEHSSYITGCHAHSAMFGVKGNVALASMFYCVQHLVSKEYWSPKMVKTIFWCLNAGIAMMMFLSLFPIGFYQTFITLKYGFWKARSHEILQGWVFQNFAKARALGGHLFVWGGLLPVVYFVTCGWFHMKPVTETSKTDNAYKSSWLINGDGTTKKMQ